MPTLTPRPGTTPPKVEPKVEVKEEPIETKPPSPIMNGNHKNELEDITDDEMDISDSDEYDETEMNKSIEEQPPVPPPLTARPVPAQPVPAPPPLRSRPSRFDVKGPPPLARAPTSTETAAVPPQVDEIPKFKKITENEYLCKKELIKAGKESRKMECECRPSKVGSIWPKFPFFLFQ